MGVYTTHNDGKMRINSEIPLNSTKAVTVRGFDIYAEFLEFSIREYLLE